MIKHPHFIGYSEGPAVRRWQTNMGMASNRVNPSETNKAPRCTKAMPKHGKEMAMTKQRGRSVEDPVNVPFNHFYIMEVDTFEAFHFE